MRGRAASAILLSLIHISAEIVAAEHFIAPAGHGGTVGAVGIHPAPGGDVEPRPVVTARVPRGDVYKRQTVLRIWLFENRHLGRGGGFTF